MKATEQYFPVVLFIMLYKVVLTFESVDEILWCDHSNDTSFVELLHSTSHFLGFYKKKERNMQFCEFITLYKEVLTFESVDEILWYDHSDESY